MTLHFVLIYTLSIYIYFYLSVVIIGYSHKSLRSLHQFLLSHCVGFPGIVRVANSDTRGLEWEGSPLKLNN